MSDNRNTSSVFDRESRGTVCIDTYKVFDACRDRDCFENARVYLTPANEELLSSANSVRTRSAKILSAYVGVNEVPFNCGFFQVTVRYYVLIDIEVCQGLGRSQTFNGLSVLEKDVILFGGEGTVTTFSSDPENSYCLNNAENRGTTDPVAIVETVEPMVLGTKIVECPPKCPCNDCLDLPACVKCNFDGELDASSDGNSPRLYASFGVFSVVRIVRPAQMLIQSTDYSVPDKECVPASNDENPCSVFNNMPFPTARFRSAMCSADNQRNGNSRCNSCGGK